MRVRLAYALLCVVALALVAAGCGGNSRPYAFGGNPNTSPGGGGNGAPVTGPSR